MKKSISIPTRFTKNSLITINTLSEKSICLLQLTLEHLDMHMYIYLKPAILLDLLLSFAVMHILWLQAATLCKYF